MNRFMLSVLCVALASGPISITPQSDRDAFAERLLASARTIRCRFTIGSRIRLDSVPIKVVQRTSADSSDIFFDRIDRQHHVARAVSDVGTSSVNLIASKEALSFVEIPPLSGFPNVYTVFGRLAPGSPEVISADLLGVVSVHMIAGHDVIATQDYGRCHVVPN
jgi:hypothetical protein